MRVAAGSEILVGVRPQTGYTYTWYEMNAAGAGVEIGTGAAIYYKPTKDIFLKVIANNTCGISECITEVELSRGFAR